MSITAFRIFSYSAVGLFILSLFYVSIRARKNVRPALSFAYLIFWVGIAIGGNFAGLILTTQEQANSQLWLYAFFGGTILAAPALVIFILTHLRSKLGARFIFRLILHIPAILLTSLVMTNSYHQLVWNTSAIPFQPDFFGPACPSILMICASYATVSLFLLLERFSKTERIYHLQYSLFMVGILFPGTVTIYAYFYTPPLQEALDYMVAGWSLMLLVHAFALLRLPMFGMLPIAQSELLRHIRDGFLITNPHQEVIFINPAAQKALQISDHDALGKPLSTLISAMTKKIIINTEMEHTSFELQVEEQYYHVNISSIKSRRDHTIGQIVMIYDVTAQTEFSNQFREQANKDELTNLFNRRYLLEQARVEFERSRRYHIPFSIIMLDLDNLKRINDQFGHITGDTAIQAFSATCQAALRGSDTIGRFGGDEFVVLLPHTDTENALNIVHRLTAKLEQTQIDTEQGPLRLSASFGITSLDEDADTNLEDMIKRADKALYLAKSDPKSCFAEVYASLPS